MMRVHLLTNSPAVNQLILYTWCVETHLSTCLSNSACACCTFLGVKAGIFLHNPLKGPRLTLTRGFTKVRREPMAKRSSTCWRKGEVKVNTVQGG